ncbi:hypothetical protein JCM10212_000655 [Sporobolomyces blumeae]
MSFLFHGYISLLQRYTLPTQMVTGGITSAAGDLVYQLGIQKKPFDSVEWYKTRRLLLYGSVCFAPVSNRWHWILNKVRIDGSKWSTIGARTLTDMMIFSPFATCYFYLCGGMMEGRPWTVAHDARAVAYGEQGIKERIEERLWGTVKLQWAVFAPAAMVSFGLVPVYARPPFMNMISIGWSAFLASAAHKGGIAPAPVELKDGTPMEVAAAEVMQ